jgi:cation:H+ antiporter
MVFFSLCIMLILILVAAEIFTNGLEHFGHKLKISEGVTGSIFAAVGTALPETIIPLTALLSISTDITTSHAIGVGAILGAPLMLSTVAIGLLSVAVISKRGFYGKFTPELSGIKRDLDFFLVVFIFAGAALFIPHNSYMAKLLIASAMICIYFFYIYKTIKASKKLVGEGHVTVISSPMYLSRIGFPVNTLSIVIQLVIGLALLILGAKGLIHYIEIAASIIGLPILILSIMLIPLATELPEKVNSFLWIRRNKDTLAFGNLTGAMIFQGSLLPAIGILLTPWEANREIILLFVITLLSTFWIRRNIHKGGIKVWHLFINMSCYVLYIFLVFKYI